MDVLRVVSTVVMTGATIVLAVATYRLWRATDAMANATRSMAAESKNATAAYVDQTGALNALAGAFSAGVKVWQDAQDRRLAYMRRLVVWEMDRNRYILNQTPLEKPRSFTLNVWPLYRAESIFTPEEGELCDILYESLNMLDGKSGREAATAIELPGHPRSYGTAQTAAANLLGGTLLGALRKTYDIPKTKPY